jgi:hypothetical protein
LPAAITSHGTPPHDGDEHDRNHPMLAASPRRARRKPLQRDTTDDARDIGRGVDTDPPGRQTRVHHRPAPPAEGFLRPQMPFLHALERVDSAGPDRLHERLKILLVLIGVALGELGDRSVERVVVAEVLADGERIP